MTVRTMSHLLVQITRSTIYIQGTRKRARRGEGKRLELIYLLKSPTKENQTKRIA